MSDLKTRRAHQAARKTAPEAIDPRTMNRQQRRAFEKAAKRLARS